MTEPEPGPRLVSDEELGAAHVQPPRLLAGPVVLVEPRASWAEQGAAETARVRSALGDGVLRVEHVGSGIGPAVNLHVFTAECAEPTAWWRFVTGCSPTTGRRCRICCGPGRFSDSCGSIALGVRRGAS